MLDGIELERAGVPTAVILTDVFIATGQAMAETQGAPDYAFAVVEHPISNRDEAGVQQLARQAQEQVEQLLLGPNFRITRSQLTDGG
ncbi:MAG: hypothetical protein HY329_09250 [Chloroflexi bacterium]|nr:hypothetical protein [Chloroflexota bacterium]